MKKQVGFSLVELVIVIIVVGLLAVAALPRFLNVTDEAKKASIQGVAGGYATAALSARAQWEAYGRPTEGSGASRVQKVNYDGTEFYLTVATTDGKISDGYPLSLSDKKISAIDSSDCVDLMQNLLQNPPLVTSNSTEAQTGKYLFYVTKETADAQSACRYYQLASANAQGDVVSNLTSGHSFIYKPAKGQVEVVLN
ncbi:prepilin-type N-terminal cleavage/methylation domain-containing protein [Photobacterium swingsii]|uniref:Prepilin-type N-terminal cleavage/methylation domain-containing protein n=1 Tax=Photobacterium swingsii TaxID=680026 RepID=A0A0J8VAG5_9GAMM|nr:prepilin-type N-terminal cleavage/methylation domain-containing protein [Photobacterium swingsii]KMV30127.1 MSHA biogenesis protein MshB [Photobacterium swingsii]PSW22678.1 prepilin-type N-terminal cleavage/methylation domain-containing protein [Photobacterium swingsii]